MSVPAAARRLRPRADIVRAVPRARGGAIAALLVPPLLALVFLHDYLGGHILPFGDDILLLYYPLMSLLSHALHSGSLLLWNPYSGGGYALVPYSALPFYVPTWLLAILPVPAAMGWTYALDLTMGGLGTYALAACLGVRGGARLVGAAVYPFSGFVLAHLYAGHYMEVGLICWLPAALAGLHWAVATPAWRTALRRGAIAGGPLGMLILANGVSWLPFTAYPVLIVALVLIGRAARRGGLRAAAAPALALSASGLVALLLGAAVLLPLRDAVGESLRGSPMDFHAVVRISESPLGLAMLLAPGLFGSDPAHSYWFSNSDLYFQEVYAYAGLLPMALAVVGALLGRRRPDVLLYAALTLLGIVLALGAYTPLYGLAYHLVPGLDVARVPARWLLTSVIGVAVLAAVGADALAGAVRTAPEPGQRRAPVLPALLALLILVALGLVGLAVAALQPEAARHGVTLLPALWRLLLVALAAGLAVVVTAQVPRTVGCALLVAVTLGDLWTANGMLVQPLDPAPYYRGAAVDLARRAVQDGRVWALDRSVPLRLGMLDRGTYDVQDYAPLTRLDYWLFTHPGESLQGVDTGMERAIMTRYNARVARILGVTFVVSPRPLAGGSLRPLARLQVPRWGLLNGDWSHPGKHPGTAYAYRVVNALPFAMPIYTERRIAGGVRLADVFAPGFDPGREVLLDGSAPPAASGAPITALLDAWRRSPQPAASTSGRAVGPHVIARAASENALRLDVTMQRSGVLLLDQIYDPSWQATVDGRATALQRADYLLTALPLSAGKHTVSLVYAPSSYLLGGLLTLLGYLLWLAAMVAAWLARARFRHMVSPDRAGQGEPWPVAPVLQ
jgi:hypothetical protein